MLIQAVIIDKNIYTKKEAIKWMLDHEKDIGKPIKKVHITTNYYRFRIRDPREFARFIIKSISTGIKLVLGE